uniref:Uncharacterized protein B11H24.100 n=1 Tax=Neurospora crassa TaxID=5141 RepID=Q8X0J3_NEUCS|nr:putative protein [Neurospora crassa]
MTSQDLFASVNASFSKNSQPSTPSHTIQENDYSVPAPPPPSPVEHPGLSHFKGGRIGRNREAFVHIRL